MEQKDFYWILRRYRLGQLSGEDKKMIDEWYEAMGQQPDTVPDSKESEELEKRYWRFIASHIRKNRNQSLRQHDSASADNKILIWTTTGVAASVLLAVAAFFYITDSRISTTEKLTAGKEEMAVEWKELTNNKNTAQQVTLPDGSKVQHKMPAKR
jgi:hypothetical protein